MMKKFVSILLASMLVFSLAGCSSSGNNADSGSEAEVEQESKQETITVTCLDGAGEETEVEVPYDPQRVAVVDMASLDILDNLGLGDRVVGSSTTALDYLQDYVNNDEIENLGTIKEADMEAVMACEPEIIFMSGRMSESYDALCEIAPVVRLTTDVNLGLVESVRKNATTIASIFGLEDKVDATMADFAERIEAINAVSEGKTALVGMCTSGSFNILGNDGRCSLIGVECGFENLGVDVVAEESSSGHGGSGSSEGRGNGEGQGSGERSGEGHSSDGQGSGGTATHGNEASFELIVSLNPDYIFVMDRDAAIGTDGAQLAKDIMENELVMSTDAYKNGNLVILEHPGVWYTAEGGITALDIMISDLESALLAE